MENTKILENPEDLKKVLGGKSLKDIFKNKTDSTLTLGDLKVLAEALTNRKWLIDFKEPEEKKKETTPKDSLKTVIKK